MTTARSKSGLFALLCVALLASSAFTQQIEGIREDWKEATKYTMASQASEEAARGYYPRFESFRGINGYAQARISVLVGGVLVGRPPDPLVADAAIEPLAVSEFDYQILRPANDKPTRVQMSFGTASGTTWEFVVPAVVVPIMTAVATDDIGVIYTLTAELRAATVHPALEGSRFCIRPAVLDLMADNRISDELKRTVEVARQTLEVARQTLPEEKRSYLLSFIEERPWTLTPKNLARPVVKYWDQNANDWESAMAFKHRIAFNDPKEKSYVEFEKSNEVNEQVRKSMLPSELVMYQEFNDAVIVHRIAHEILAGRIVAFPHERWTMMLRELANVDRNNRDANVDVLSLSRGWHSYARSRVESPDHFPDPPVPGNLKLR